jgi:hypothetical protein
MFPNLTLSKAWSIIGCHSRLLAVRINLVSMQIFLHFMSAWKVNASDFLASTAKMYICTVGNSDTV